MMDNKDFYNQLAATYDEMILFKSALERKRISLKKILKSDMKTVADIGCGTGLDSIVLSQLGLEVTAFDPSQEMLKKAEANSVRAALKIDFHNHFVHKIPESHIAKFNLVISSGNTFANIPKNLFDESIKKCFDLLKEKGLLVIQVLNYEKILRQKNRILNINEADDKIFVRFYDFEKDKLFFNVLAFDKYRTTGNVIITTELFPHSKNNFEQSLAKAGFTEIEFSSSLSGDKFDPETSQDLFIKSFKS
jgi:glycine/sarcosine N-methyltransferase